MERVRWRENWLYMLKCLTDIEYQEETWLNPNNKNLFYSFVEFMCSYFDDLDLTDGYERFIKMSFISEQEYKTIAEWHELLSTYDAPNDDNHDHKAILNDEKWLEIVEVGRVSIVNLKPMLDQKEREILV